MIPLNKQNIKTKILEFSVYIGGRTYIDYSSIKGEILGSVLIGAVNTENNDNITKLIPEIAGASTQYNTVRAVHCEGNKGSTFFNILVFYK